MSDKRSLHGLQTKLSAIWPYDKTNVNVKKIKYTKHNIEMTAIFMGERKEIKPFKEFYDIWKDKCIVVPKADQHLYPAEISVDKRAQWNITDTQEQA